MLRCGISIAGIVENKRACSVCCVADAGSVEQKRRYTDSRIVICGIKVKRFSADSAVLELPVVVAKSEYQPTAVFPAPVVRL